MKKLISLLVVIGVVGVWLPAMGQEEDVYDQSVYFLQSRDAGNPSPELEALCEDPAMIAEALARVPGWPFDISALNAEWWTAQPRSKDGMIVSEFIHQVGTVLGCAYLIITDPGPPPVFRIALYGDSDTDFLDFVGWGECDLPIAGIPTANSFTGNCIVLFGPDSSQGVAKAIGTSNSVFGHETGSFWTFRVFWE